MFSLVPRAPRSTPPLSVLHAALHGGLPPPLLAAFTAEFDSDSDNEEQSQQRVMVRSTVPPTCIPRELPPTSSAASSTSSSSSSSSKKATCAVLDAPREILLRERSHPSAQGGRRFCARDSPTSDRLFSIEVKADGAGVCVVCNDGMALWSVLAANSHGASARSRILRKESSPYYIVLGAQHWATHIERRALGYLHALPHLRRAPALALEVLGDALAKRFTILGRDAQQISTLAHAKRSTKLAQVRGVVRELSSWHVCVERNVDCTMVAAVVYVLEEWCSASHCTLRN